MAGFGDMALAFAGGAAKQANDDFDSEREHRKKIDERRKDLQMQQRMRMEESRYTRETVAWEKERELIRNLDSAKGNTALQQLIIAEHKGIDRKTLRAMQKQGKSVGAITYKQRYGKTAPKANVSSVEDILRIDETESTMHKLFGGRKRAERATPAEQATPEDTSSYQTYGGTEEIQWDQFEEGKTIEVNGQVFVEDGNGGYTRKLDARTAPVVKPELHTGVPKLFKELSTGKDVYLTEKGGELYKDGRRVTQNEYQVQTDDTTTDTSAAMRRRRGALKDQISNSGEILNAISELSKYKTARAKGVRGAVVAVPQFFIDQYESIVGAPVGEDGIKPTTLASHMSRDFNADESGEARTLFEERMAQGKSQVYETILLYKTARMLKGGDDKLNMDDVKRAEKMLGIGIGGGRAEAGGLGALKVEATARGRGQLMAFLAENEIKTTGRVAYDPKDRVWRYETIQDGKPAYIPLY